VKPTFIGLGAQKCASTWLHRLLSSHPQVDLPDVKEIDFFSYHFDHGYQWYERHFDALAPDRCTGEVSPSYFHDPSAPQRVSSYSPDAKLLVTLRDPVERAVSNHKHEIRLGHLAGEDLSFEAGLNNNPMYVEQGLYGKHLANWLTSFPRRQIYVALMEDIQDKPVQVAREVFRFLGIDDSFESPVVTTRFNASFANRSQGLVRIKDRVYQLSQSPGMGWLWSTAAGIGARDVYRRFNVVHSETVIPPVSPATVGELRRRFASDIHRLETLLDRNLSHWLCTDEAEHNGAYRSGGASE
jgi:hypothetical protein